MKKLVVNTAGCIGCGACVGIDEEHFDFNEDNLSYVKSQENLNTEALQDAIESCPVAVITLEDVEDSCDCQCEECNCEDPCDCQCKECNCNKDEIA